MIGIFPNVRATIRLVGAIRWSRTTMGGRRTPLLQRRVDETAANAHRRASEQELLMAIA